MTETLMSVEELAAFLAVPVKTVYKWRAEGSGPRAHKVGRHLRFRRADVERWLDQRADAAV